PKDVTINGQSFTSEEMKYLAAEYYGNFGDTDLAWQLKRGELLGGLYYLPAFFKPGSVMGKSTLMESIKHLFRGNDEWLDSPKLVEFAEKSAKALIDKAGSEDAFQKLTNEWMGQLAAEFYQALIDNMRIKKHPLASNVRSYKDDGGPEEV